MIENLKTTTLRLKEEKKGLEEKVTNTIDSYEEKLATLQRKHTETLREESEVRLSLLSYLFSPT